MYSCADSVRRTEGGLRSRPVPGSCCIAGVTCFCLSLYCWHNLLLPVVVLLALTCSCRLLYYWCSPVSVGCYIAGMTSFCRLLYCWHNLLPPVVVLLALTCFYLLLYCWRDLLLPIVVLPALICFRLLSAPINNREQARCAGRFPVRRNKKSAQPDTADTAAYRTKPIN